MGISLDLSGDIMTDTQKRIVELLRKEKYEADGTDASVVEMTEKQLNLGILLDQIAGSGSPLQIKFRQNEDDDGGVYTARTELKYLCHETEKVKIPLRGAGESLTEALEDLLEAKRLAMKLFLHQIP